MVKQNASLDASFWINACAANLVQHVVDYFVLFANTKVAEEIRYPLDVLGIASQTVTMFNSLVQSGEIKLQDPEQPVDWFQQGENSAIALAIERNYFLLIDDANPYHRAKAAGLSIVGSAEFAVLLYDHERITAETAAAAIQQTHASKKQKRLALTILENLKRIKEN